jgi:tetratricopeptide (TPR) repeat protein
MTTTPETLAALANEGKHRPLRKQADAFVTAHPERFEGYWYRAYAVLLEGGLDTAALAAAAKDLSRARKLAPDFDATFTIPSPLTSGANGSAFAYLELLEARRISAGSRAKQAQKRAARAVELDPEWPELRLWLGRISRDAGDYATSEAAFSWLIEREPEEAGYYYERILARQNLGDHQGEIADWRRRIELQPDRAGHYVGLGRALRKVDDRAGAIAAFERALAIDADATEAHTALAALRDDAP